MGLITPAKPDTAALRMKSPTLTRATLTPRAAAGLALPPTAGVLLPVRVPVST